MKPENNIGLCILVSFVLAFILPESLFFFEQYLIYMLVFQMYLVFLKIDIGDILSHTKKPVMLAKILLINVIGIPLALFVLAYILFDVDLVVGILLFATLPAGVTSSALTHILKGKASLAVIITVLTSLLAPLTLPFSFYMLLGKSIQLDYIGLMTSLALVIIAPMVAAQFLRTNKFHNYTESIIILFIVITITSVLGSQRDHIIANWHTMIGIVLSLIGMFLLKLFGSYYVYYKHPKKERIALACTNTFVNIAMGIVLAYEYFGPHIALIMILGEVGWGSMIVVFRWFLGSDN